MTKQRLLLVLGNQLFPIGSLPAPKSVRIFMAEDRELCTHVRHHQQKLVLVLSAMRAYRDELLLAGYDVDYYELRQSMGIEHELASTCQTRAVRELVHFEIEGNAMERRIERFAEKNSLERTVLPSPMFLCTRNDFKDYLQGVKKPFMADFYKRQRKRFQILITESGQPVGGQWSFDAQNRKKLPKSVSPPTVHSAQEHGESPVVKALVAEEFKDHPGTVESAWLPTTSAEADRWLTNFLNERLAQFGPFEDAISQRSAVVFHSVLSPLLNIGLLTPRQVLDRTIEHATANEIPLNSLEGFVRQVLGWREFVRGVYQNFSQRQRTSNFWGHHRQLTSHWYTGDTGIPPLDDAINGARTRGWTHHIPRLMVLGNLMTLAEIEPRAVHRWFMEMYVDAYNWVMGPNVFGMGIFSDGGVFATKPYICGSNYLLKMSDYKKGDWCDVVDGLYWRFVEKHAAFFRSNPRLALTTRALTRLDPERKHRILAAAEVFLQRFTREGVEGNLGNESETSCQTN